MRRLTALAAAALVGLSAAAGSVAGAAGPGPLRPGSPLASAGSTSAGSSAAALSDAHVRRRPVSARAARALGAGGEIRGMAINDVSPARPATAAIADFPRLAAEGVTSVAVYVYLYVSDPSGNDVTTGLYTPTDAELQLISTAASLNGLGVQLMPVLLDHATNTWRGRYHPSDEAAFFASYTAQVVHYADLAQSLGVQLFYVGSENRSLETRTSRWVSLIATVRRHFSGALSYMAIPSSAGQVRFFDLLDFASISPYFSLGEDPLPSYDRDVAAWKQVNLPAMAKIVKMTKAPVIYGEIGYNSLRGGFTVPQAAAPKTGSPAPAAQADAYAALLDELAQTPGVYGVTWWRWTTGTTPLDLSFSPNGKPAECVLAAHWSHNAEVRAAAALPVCDLHFLDSAAAGLPPLP